MGESISSCKKYIEEDQIEISEIQKSELENKSVRISKNNENNESNKNNENNENNKNSEKNQSNEKIEKSKISEKNHENESEKNKLNSQIEVNLKSSLKDVSAYQNYIEPYEYMNLSLFAGNKINSLNEPSEISQQKIQSILVPFAVIQKIMIKEIIQQLQVELPQFFITNRKQDIEKNSTWTLSQKGCYMKNTKIDYGIILTDTQFYLGEFEEKQNKYVPQGKGMCILKEGKYKGLFLRGKTSGQGLFDSYPSHNEFKGFWKDGKFQEGTIETKDFIFNGKIEDGANANGTLLCKKSKSKYSGRIQNGKYEDKKGVLIFDDYVYKGGFKNGKKNGQGYLHLEAKTIKVNNKQQYIPAIQLVGQWNNDKFISQK